VFKLIPQGEMTVARILQELRSAYAGDVTMRAHATVAEYRACKRAGGHLKDHLLNWRRLRTEAMSTGLLKEQDADAFDLLSSCGLSTQQRQIVNGQFSQSEKQAKASGDVTWTALNGMIAELKNLEQAFAAGDMNEKHAKTKPSGDAQALIADGMPKGGKPKGGKGGKGKGGKGKGGKSKGGKSKGGHGKGEYGKSVGKIKQGQTEPDWTCGNKDCHHVTFGKWRATFCSRCGTAKGATAPAE